MYSRILNCDYEFVSPWWDEVSLNAKDLVSFSNHLPDIPTYVSYLRGPKRVKGSDNKRKHFNKSCLFNRRCTMGVSSLDLGKPSAWLILDFIHSDLI